MYFYIKALHIIFIVTWFSGLFYIVRLFVYNREAQDKEAAERLILSRQFAIMIRRLWLGITWPSCILTVVFGGWMWYLLDATPMWLLVKFVFVGLLLAYHFSIHAIYRQQAAGDFRITSQQLRIWNEVATILLVAIVMLAVVKQSISWVWGLAGLSALIIILMAAIRIYKQLRK